MKKKWQIGEDEFCVKDFNEVENVKNLEMP